MLRPAVADQLPVRVIDCLKQLRKGRRLVDRPGARESRAQQLKVAPRQKGDCDDAFFNHGYANEAKRLTCLAFVWE